MTDHEPRTTFVEVANELLAQAGEEWSEPLRFRFKQLPSGMVELIFRRDHILAGVKTTLDGREVLIAAADVQLVYYGTEEAA